MLAVRSLQVFKFARLQKYDKILKSHVLRFMSEYQKSYIGHTYDLMFESGSIESYGLNVTSITALLKYWQMTLYPRLVPTIQFLSMAMVALPVTTGVLPVYITKYVHFSI